MNVYDSERMRDVLQPLGYALTEKPDDADPCHPQPATSARRRRRKSIPKSAACARTRSAAPPKAGMTITIAGCVAQAEGRRDHAPRAGRSRPRRPANHKLPELIARAARNRRALADFTAQEKFDALRRAMRLMASPRFSVRKVAINSARSASCRTRGANIRAVH